MSERTVQHDDAAQPAVDALIRSIQQEASDAPKNVSLTPETTASDAVWNDFAAAFAKYHHDPDIEAARVVYAAVAAHRLKGAPVWPMPIAPPGSGKGVALDNLQGLDKVHFIDELTPKTFLSGHMPDPNQPTEKSASLLHRIGSDGIMVISDFSTILSSQADDRNKIMAQLRRIYDGQFRREYGTAHNLDEREWSGRLTVVAAVTPDIDRHRGSVQSLGERFLSVRWPRAGGTEAALAAMNQDIAEKKITLRALVHELFAGIPTLEPTVPEVIQHQIAALAEFTVRARTDVPRDARQKSVLLYMPEAESATRLSQQLTQLAKGSALLSGRAVVRNEDYHIVRRAAMDSLPPLRRAYVHGLLTGTKPKAALAAGSTLYYLKADLELLSLLDGSWFTDDAVGLLTAADFVVPPRPPKNWGE